MAEADSASPFQARTIAWVIVAGLIAFIGFIWLTAYAPQLKMREGGAGDALSKSAVGFYGIIQLIKEIDGAVETASDEEDWSNASLLIVPVPETTDREQLQRLISVRSRVGDMVTLFVLPKWLVTADPSHRGWVRSIGMVPPEALQPLLTVIGDARLRERPASSPDTKVIEGIGGSYRAQSPPAMRWIDGGNPVLADSAGHSVLARIDATSHRGAKMYVLADPDLIANLGMRSPDAAQSAVALMEWLKPVAGDAVTFDTVLSGGASGGENSRNLLQLMFEPPFLALTLAVLVAAIMTGMQAFGRFGPAAIEPRAIPFGKRALTDNAAVLIARAGAEKRLGDRYVTLTRDAAAAALGASAMAPEAQEVWLAGLPHKKGTDFATLADNVRTAPNAHAMQAAARDLFEWKRDVTRDR